MVMQSKSLGEARVLQLLLAIFASLVPGSIALCNTTLSYNGTPRIYANCSDLGQNNASVAWTYKAINNTLDVAFSGFTETYGGWVGWGINENCSVMQESSTLIAFRAVNGSTVLPYKLTQSLYTPKVRVEDVGPPPLRCTPIDLVLLETAVAIVDYEVTIFASIQLKPGQTKIHQIWNNGIYVDDWVPSAPCGPNRQGLGTLDLNTGLVTNIGQKRRCPIPNLHLKNRHAIVNGVAWGVLYPTSIIVGYFTICLPPCFYVLFIPFQFLAFSIGVAGFYTGAILSELPGATNQKYHRNLGITIVTLASFQVFLSIIRICLRKRGYDGEIKGNIKLLMVVSALVGYVNNIIVIVNIFKGLSLLEAQKGWKTLWIVISLFSLALVNWA